MVYALPPISTASVAVLNARAALCAASAFAFVAFAVTSAASGVQFRT
jgi:hypothetical protein